MSTEPLAGNTLSRLGRNVRWLAFLQIVLLGVRLFSNGYLARLFGPDGLGQYLLALLWLEVISDVHGLSLEDVIPRNAAQEPHRRGELLGASLAVFMLVTPALVVATFGLTFFYTGRGISFWALLLASIVRTPTRYFLAFPAADENLRPFSLWQAAERAGIAILTVVVLFAGGSVELILSLLAPFYLLIGAPFVASVLRTTRPRAITRDDVQRLGRLGLEFTGLKAVSILYGRVDALLVDALMGPTSTGYYLGARQVLTFLRSIPLAISSGLYPVLSRKVSDGALALALGAHALREDDGGVRASGRGRGNAPGGSADPRLSGRWVRPGRRDLRADDLGAPRGLDAPAGDDLPHGGTPAEPRHAAPLHRRRRERGTNGAARAAAGTHGRGHRASRVRDGIAGADAGRAGTRRHPSRLAHDLPGSGRRGAGDGSPASGLREPRGIPWP